MAKFTRIMSTWFTCIQYNEWKCVIYHWSLCVTLLANLNFFLFSEQWKKYCLSNLPTPNYWIQFIRRAPSIWKLLVVWIEGQEFSCPIYWEICFQELNLRGGSSLQARPFIYCCVSGNIENSPTISFLRDWIEINQNWKPTSASFSRCSCTTSTWKPFFIPPAP